MITQEIRTGNVTIVNRIVCVDNVFSEDFRAATRATLVDAHAIDVFDGFRGKERKEVLKVGFDVGAMVAVAMKRFLDQIDSSITPEEIANRISQLLSKGEEAHE